MNLKLLPYVMFCFIGFSAVGQKVLLEKSVVDSITLPEKGPNSKKFGHFFYTMTNYIPFNDQGIQIETLGSMQYEIGWRYKRKINNTFSFGYAFSFSFQDYKIHQDSLKTFPVNQVYDKEKVKLSTLTLELYQRINFGQRGDYMGIFADIGIRGGWNYFNKRIVKNKLNMGNQGKILKTSYIQPDYIKKFQYGPVFRFGVNHVMLWISYLISDTIDQEDYAEDFEGLWMGVQLGLHQ